MKAIKVGLVLFLMCFTLPVFSDEAALSDAQIRQILIKQSISQYSGNCPCPYNRASNGSRCGKRSAYSRPGGYSPLCFERDVSEKMLKNYRERGIK